MSALEGVALDALYAELPRINCQGKCSDSCGPIGMSRLEWKRVCDAAGGEKKATSLTCPLLVNDRCSVYAVRPMICRLWGIEESMPCPWGCKPSPRYLTRKEGHEFLWKAEVLGR